MVAPSGRSTTSRHCVPSGTRSPRWPRSCSRRRRPSAGQVVVDVAVGQVRIRRSASRWTTGSTPSRRHRSPCSSSNRTAPSFGPSPAMPPARRTAPATRRPTRPRTLPARCRTSCNSRTPQRIPWCTHGPARTVSCGASCTRVRSASRARSTTTAHSKARWRYRATTRCASSWAGIRCHAASRCAPIRACS